jgi:hypothetical protein
MIYLAAGGLALLLLFSAARLYTSVDPAQLTRFLRYGVGWAFVLAGVVMMIAQRWGLGAAMMVVGYVAIARGRLGPFDLGGSRRHAGMTSTVRSAWLEMRLDHDTGGMTGTVLRGASAGEALDDLDVEGLVKLYAEIGSDAESAALLEAYLDRRVPGWREDVEVDDAARTGGAPNAGPMTDEQAYEILGLLPGAGEAEIRAAHRRLMKRVHPDQGGSTFLAAKINQAKDWLLSKHR